MRLHTFIIALCCFFGLAGRAQETHHGAPSADGSLYFRAEPVNNFFTDKTDELYYYIHLQGTEKRVTGAPKRMPLNLSVVIDRSGSMTGQKMEYTKQAVKYLVTQLDKNDMLSIVLYDTEVEVFLEPQHIENKKHLLERIDKIITLNSTNLEGGIRKGFELVKKVKAKNEGEMVHRVLLLSDGLANVGMSDPTQLSDLTRSFFEKDRIAVSTFGVGNDYNEDLMARMAMQGGGRYYFIDSPEKMESMFTEELQGISQVIAKNTTLKITFPDEVLSYSRTFAYNSSLDKNTLTLHFNDLFANEQKSILICFKTKSPLKNAFTISCALDYMNASGENTIAVSDSRSSEVKPARDAKEYDSGINRAAAEGYALELTAEWYEEAVQLCDRERFDDAKKKVHEAIELLDNHFQKTGENVYLRDFQKKLKDYEALIEDMKHMDRDKLRLQIKSHKSKKFRTISCPAF
jgi:Ca-activated chloride channel family protein